MCDGMRALARRSRNDNAQRGFIVSHTVSLVLYHGEFIVVSISWDYIINANLLGLYIWDDIPGTIYLMQISWD